MAESFRSLLAHYHRLSRQVQRCQQDVSRLHGYDVPIGFAVAKLGIREAISLRNGHAGWEPGASFHNEIAGPE